MYGFLPAYILLLRKKNFRPNKCLWFLVSDPEKDTNKHFKHVYVGMVRPGYLASTAHSPHPH